MCVGVVMVYCIHRDISRRSLVGRHTHQRNTVHPVLCCNCYRSLSQHFLFSLPLQTHSPTHKHTRMHTHSHTHTHARTHTHTHARTHTQSRYCTNLQLPTSVQKAASHIAKTAVDMDLAPGYPHCIIHTSTSFHNIILYVYLVLPCV